MPKKAQLYLHIGHAKAGSTTLQAFLFKNWAYLEAQGFAIPTADFNVSNPTQLPGNPLLALQAIKKKRDIEPLRQWIIEASKTHPKLLLSSECLFEWAWHKLFINLTDLMDIHLIYYVRRQDEVLLSAWRQWGLKTGQPLDAFIDSRVAKEQPNYWASIAPWRNKVGLASLHVRFVHTTFLENGDIQQDLAHHLDLDFAKMQPVENQNVGLDARLLLFMSERPEMFASVHDDSIFELLRDKNIAHKPLRLTLNTSQFGRIFKAFESKNQEFLEEFHPAKAGTPVINPNTAPINQTALPISQAEIIAYVKSRIETIGQSNDSRINVLKAELLTKP